MALTANDANNDVISYTSSTNSTMFEATQSGVNITDTVTNSTTYRLIVTGSVSSTDSNYLLLVVT